MNAEPPTLLAPAPAQDASPVSSHKPVAPDTPDWRRWLAWPRWCMGRVWQGACLCVLLAVVAAVPVIQLASLGYLLNSAARLAQRQPWSKAFPGATVAGRLGKFACLAAILWLPVWFITDLSYSAQLLLPNSSTAWNWRLLAGLMMLAWLTWISWAAIRGGSVRHFLWPAPVLFFRRILLLRTWLQASDALYELVARLHFLRLWWLGARAAGGALLWMAIPVSLMIIGQRADNFPPAVLVGLVGAVSMTVLMLYLPFLQIQMAVDNRFRSMFAVNPIRQRFLYAPWAHAGSLLLLCLVSIPLYLLRIEATPSELVWAPSLVFVLFMLPAKLTLGSAMGYASGRQACPEVRPRHWALRWSARGTALAGVLVYVGALYVAQLVAGQGALVMFFQHALLVPAPLISS